MKFWTWLRSNPYFMAGVGAFGGAILNGLHQEVLTGSINWSLKGWESLGTTALGVAIISVYALYTHTPATAKAIAAGKIADPDKVK